MTAAHGSAAFAKDIRNGGKLTGLEPILYPKQPDFFAHRSRICTGCGNQGGSWVGVIGLGACGHGRSTAKTGQPHTIQKACSLAKMMSMMKFFIYERLDFRRCWVQLVHLKRRKASNLHRSTLVRSDGRKLPWYVRVLVLVLVTYSPSEQPTVASTTLKLQLFVPAPTFL